VSHTHSLSVFCHISADRDTFSNVSGAQRELLKYYASVSSNRMLMVKIFGVLISASTPFPLRLA
jgi:hypothetical protein